MMLKFRRRILTWKIWLGFGSFVLCWMYWDQYIRYSWNIENENLDRTKLDIPSSEKIILLWTSFFYENYIEAWGIRPMTLDKCQYKCHFTVDKSLFPVSDAVVYHGFAEGHNLIFRNQYMYPLPKPKHRRPEQIWIYYMLEPPLPKMLYEIYDTLGDHYDFNWTMTYRRDSDIFLPYGKFKPLTDADDPPEALNVSHKTALLAGMISECKRESGREGYIEELKKFIPVDIYGKCGTLHCSRKENCYEKLGKKYKFWLSFENSLCPEYLTEKFYRPMNYGMIPVYYGHPDAPALLRAPPGSYINTNDFESPEALAKHLIFLDQNPTEYLKYLEWRKSYRVLIANKDVYWAAWCDVCTKLHELSSNDYRVTKSYRSVADWFLRNNTNKSICLKPSYHV